MACRRYRGTVGRRSRQLFCFNDTPTTEIYTLSLHDALPIATVSGDAVLDAVVAGDYVVLETGQPVPAFGKRLLSAKAYIGPAPLIQALGGGTLVGHMLECAGQVTGGYFADPGCKDVDRLSDLGFPIAEVPGDGPFV